jgi:hypothetical protein
MQAGAGVALYLPVDDVLEVVVDGRVRAGLGPGSVVGELGMREEVEGP